MTTVLVCPLGDCRYNIDGKCNRGRVVLDFYGYGNELSCSLFTVRKRKYKRR